MKDYKELNKGLPDLQNSTEGFVKKHIQKVGIAGYKVPLSIFNPTTGSYSNTVASASAYASLSSEKKGVNMSRFSIAITEAVKEKLTDNALIDVVTSIKEKLEAEDAYVKFRLDYLLETEAPESKFKSWFTIPVVLEAKIDSFDTVKTFTTVEVNYTSLCPCSKEISEAGAHNQRSVAKITIETSKEFVSFEELKKIVDDNCSCPIYNTLKRVDEKYVTERAYNNPKFSEDACREIASKLDEWLNSGKIKDYVVVTQNFESIHQSDAVAVISAGKELC